MKSLALPTTTIPRKDYDAIRSYDLPAAQRALDSAAESEKVTTLMLSTCAPNLRTVSYVRPEAASSSIDSAIQYDINITPAHTLHIGNGVVPIVRPARVEISTIDVRSAEFGQLDARPRTEVSAHWAIRDWQTALSYAKENRFAAILAAGAGGVLLGEAGRVLYAHAQGTFGV